MKTPDEIHQAVGLAVHHHVRAQAGHVVCRQLDALLLAERLEVADMMGRVSDRVDAETRRAIWS